MLILYKVGNFWVLDFFFTEVYNVIWYYIAFRRIERNERINGA